MLFNIFFTFFIYTSILVRFQGNTSEIPKSKLERCEAFNLETVKCFWPVYRINNKKINLDLYYHRAIFTPRKSERKGSKCERSEYDTNGTTEWCTLHYRKHDIRHTAHNFYLKSSSPELLRDSDNLYVQRFYDIVKTGRIVFDRFNVTNHAISVHFKAPNKKEHLYELQVFGPNTNRSIFSNQTGMEIDGLRPHTLYRGMIRCVIYFNDKTMGSWSEWYSFNFKTQQDVPDASPTFSTGGFIEVQPNVYKIFLERVAESLKNGEILKSRLRVLQTCQNIPSSFLKLVNKNGLNEQDFLYMKSTKSKHMLSDTASIPVFTQNLKEFNYEVEEIEVEIKKGCYGLIFADLATAIGYNKELKLKPFLISPNRLTLEKVESINATVNSNDTYILEWKSVKHSVFYVIFYWLHASNQTSNFLKVKTNKTLLELHLENVPGKMWKFAVSTLFDDGEGGVMGSGMADVACVYNISKPLDVKRYNLHYEVRDNTVSLKWPSLDCSSSHPPYFSHYLVIYFPVNISNEVNEKIIPKQESRAKIKDLIYGLLYTFKLYAVRADSSYFLLYTVRVPIPDGPNHWILVACILLSIIITLTLVITLVIWVKNSKKTITVQTLPVEVTTVERDVAGYIQIYNPMKPA